MTFVHIADVHVGTAFSSAAFGAKKGQERRKEVKDTLLRVIDYCEEERIDLLLIAGDFYEENYVTLSELKDINGAFGELSHTKVVIAAGNHDPIIDSNSPYRLIEWAESVTLFGNSMESVSFESIGVEVWGFAWNRKHLPPLDLTGMIEPNSSYSNILMLHGDAFQDNGYQYLDQDQLKAQAVDYIAMGHVHKHSFLTPTIAYAGSLEPLDFSEDGQHGFIRGEIEGSKVVTDFVPFSKRSFHQLDVNVTPDMSFEQICQKAQNVVNRHPQEDFFKITLKGVVDPLVHMDMEELEKRLNQHSYFTTALDGTEVDLDLEQLKREYKGSIISQYIEAFEARDLEDPVVNKALYKGLRIMLEEQVNL